jgi:hypothetical protein
VSTRERRTFNTVWADGGPGWLGRLSPARGPAAWAQTVGPGRPVIRAMGQRSSTPRDDTAAGPPGNRYWTGRTSEPSWILRERLLNGDVNGVIEMLDLSSSPQRNEDDSFSEGMQSFLNWSNHAGRGSRPPPKGCMRSVDLNTFEWSDDKHNTVIHYLAMGRSRSKYVSSMTHYPIAGLHSFPGSDEIDSREGRQLLVSMLLTSGRLDINRLTSLNSQRASAFHIAASQGNFEMIQMLQTCAGDLADSLLYHRDSRGHVPSDAALLHGHVRSATNAIDHTHAAAAIDVFHVNRSPASV